MKLQKPIQNPTVPKIFTAITNAGGTACIVGGTVRNILLNLPVKDYDFATDLIPEQTIAAGEQAGFKVHETGIEHGTVVFHDEATKTDFEVTTLRRDVECDGRHATVEFHDDWIKDANRRDFTVNALYLDAANNVLDYVNGLADIKSRTLRFVGDATERIKEDRLRILRAFRFAHVLPDFRMAKATQTAIKQNNSLKGISRERIRAEFHQILMTGYPDKAVDYMKSCNVLDQVIPEAQWTTNLKKLRNTEASFPARLIALSTADTATLAEALVLTRAEIKQMDGIRKAFPDLADPKWEKNVRKPLYQHGKEVLLDAMLLTGYHELAEIVATLPVPEFPLSGQALLDRGHAPGKSLGDKLKQAENLWLDNNCQLSAAKLIKELKL